MEHFVQPVLDLLHEVYIGSNGGPTFIIDHAPGHGLITIVGSVSAKDASTPNIEGGTTIAAHTGHLKWSLDYALEFYKGEIPKRNWKDSWYAFTVNETEWRGLQKELQEAYKKIDEAIRQVKDWSNDNLVKGTFALVPHASYHLSAVKQLLLAVNARKSSES